MPKLLVIVIVSFVFSCLRLFYLVLCGDSDGLVGGTFVFLVSIYVYTLCVCGYHRGWGGVVFFRISL